MEDKEKDAVKIDKIDLLNYLESNKFNYYMREFYKDEGVRACLKRIAEKDPYFPILYKKFFNTLLFAIDDE